MTVPIVVLRWVTDIDEGVIFLVGVPLGLAIFYPISKRLLPCRWIHLVALFLGLLGMAASISNSKTLFEESRRLTGVLGPFSGLAEALQGYVFVFLAAVCVVLCVAGISGFCLARFKVEITAKPDRASP